MHRVYSNRLPGQRRIHIEINPTEIADLLADLGNEGPYDHPATDTLVDLLTAAHALFVEDEDDARDAARQATGQADTEPLRPRAERCPDPQCTDEKQCWRCDYEESQHAARHAPAPVVGQPAATPDTDQAQPARDDLYDALDQSWYRWDPQSMAKGTGIIRLIDAHAAEVRAATLREAADAFEADANETAQAARESCDPDMARTAKQLRAMAAMLRRRAAEEVC
ncbi:hypothetical protein GTY86_35690 [Streptomyces sp. SID5770]|uniref:hypothetical protein n=1 Tax=Streptomyces sp. SID5770 TaxID=2690308 RepID=UPI001367BD21|nr:hypothetical protein [Streptomyces sp. SID5770]MZE53792.1 hypothetical protein [Streptomyces sp. SID5770]MZE56519.1 hypothetical protein [Streptomyces sp. SID5770]